MRRVALAHALVLLAIELRPSPPLVAERGDDGVCQINLLLAVFVLIALPLTLGRVMIPVLDVARLSAGSSFGLLMRKHYFCRHGIQLDGEVVNRTLFDVGIPRKRNSCSRRNLRHTLWQRGNMLGPINPLTVREQEALSLVHDRLAIQGYRHPHLVQKLHRLFRKCLVRRNAIETCAIAAQSGRGRDDGDPLPSLHVESPIEIQTVETSILEVTRGAVKQGTVSRFCGTIP